MSANQTSQNSGDEKIIITCEKCGQKLRVPLQKTNLHVACPKCRHEFNYQFVEAELVDDPTENTLSPALQSPSNLSQVQMKKCPICQRNDQLIKVSSIVKQGTQEISGQTDSWVAGDKDSWVNQFGHWESVPITGTQRSELAGKLSYPAQPTQPKFFTTCLTCGLFFLGAPVIMSIIGGYAFSILDATIDGNNSLDTSTLFSNILTCAMPIIFFVLYSLWFNNKNSKYKVEKSQWDKAWYTWNRLYFCFRDDKVYDPETGKVFDASTLNHYVYSN